MFDLCRICLFVVNENQCVNVFIKMNNISLLEMIKECASIQVAEEDVLPKYICTKCAEKLNYLYEFRTLMIKSDVKLKQDLHVKKKLDRNQGRQSAVENENYPKSENCDIDDEKFATRFEIKQEEMLVERFLKVEVLDVPEPSEIITFTNDPENNASKTIKKSEPATKQKKKKILECQECNQTFKSVYSFKNHNIIHTGVQPFTCEFCNKGFPTKWAVTIHTRVHTGDKPLTCDVCQKKYGSPSALVLHKRIHNGMKKFHCDVCMKGFTQSSQLEVHKRRHTGEKPYMCEICSKTFGDKSNLIRHGERHQEGKQLPCPICGKTFQRQTCLQAHIKRHSGLKPFSCNECNQKFTKQTSLNRHKLLHSGIKPYKCKVCEKSFSQDSILVRHMRIHSGERPFPCSLCQKEFAYKHHLQGHIKNYHKETLLIETPNAEKAISDDGATV